MVEVGAGKSGSRFLKTDYPIAEGLEAGINKLREKPNLEPEDKSNIKQKDKVGL